MAHRASIVGEKPSFFGWIRSCLLLLWLLLVSPQQVSVAFIGSHKRCDPASFSCRIHQVAHEGSLIVINLFVFGRNNTLDGAQCAQVPWKLRENLNLLKLCSFVFRIKGERVTRDHQTVVAAIWVR
jgi:hypothetical protein